MGSIEVDEGRGAIVVVRFVGSVSDQEFDDYLSRMGRLLQRGKTTVTILDARESERTPPVQRRKQAAWLHENEERLKRYSAGSAFVITSPLVRGVLTAILWVRPLPVPHTVVGTMEEAESWANQQLTARSSQ